MKALIAALALICLTGCISAPYERVTENPDGSYEHVTFRVRSIFLNSRAVAVALDKSTKTTKTGLTLGEVTHEGDAQSIQALTEAIVAGAVRGATP